MGGSIKKWGWVVSVCFVTALLSLDFSPVQKEFHTESPSGSFIRDTSQTNVINWEITILSHEQFQERYTEITGEDAPKIINDQDKESQGINFAEEQFSPDIIESYEAEYAAIIDLGEEIFVQAGVLVQVQEVRDGETIRKEFRKVYENTGYLSAQNSNSIELVKNYVVGTLQHSSQLQISFNGYTEHKVNEGESEAQHQKVEDPKHFSGSGFIQL